VNIWKNKRRIERIIDKKFSNWSRNAKMLKISERIAFINMKKKR
jgi:hypothetical protein